MKRRENLRPLLDSMVLGVIGALGAQLFMLMLRFCQKIFLFWIAGYVAPGVSSERGAPHEIIGSHGLWLIPLATALGGLASGLLVYGLAPETEGHGTDTVVKAVHWSQSRLRARVPAVKMVASAITIGSGGSAGREGPAALIAAGFGSIYADLLHRKENERRLLVLMGMAAGLSAIFRSPIGTAIFAVEVLYGGMDFESDALIYCMLAAIVAYAVNGWFVGWEPLFRVPAQLQIEGAREYVWYAALGLAAGIVATVLPMIFYRVRDGFHAIRIPNWIKPAIGGGLVGLIALKLPEVLGGGYGWIQHAIDGKLALNLMFLLLVAKILAMSLTVSSGGSGGVFAPSLFVGAMLGGAFSGIFHHPPPGMVIVGMAAVFAAAARVPIATLLMVAEMTGGYQLLVPAGLAVMLSFFVQSQLSASLRYDSLYEAQVAGPADSPAHRAEQVQIALRILNQGNVTLPSGVSQLQIATVLQSGLALELPGGSRFQVGALRPESSWVGRPLQARVLTGVLLETKVVALLRGKSLLLARPETILQPGDRLLIVASARAMPELSKHLTFGVHSAAFGG